MKSWKKYFVIAVVLALGTYALVSWGDKQLPPSETKNLIHDAITIPGALLAGIFYPEGSDTGFGAPGFLYLVLVAHFLVFLAVWYGIIWAISILFLRKKSLRKERNATED